MRGQARVLFRPQVAAVGAYLFDNYPEANFGYSLAKLKTEANYAIRLYSTDSSSFQDIGFVDGYVDIDAITTFANGTLTRAEYYNQATNVLDLAATDARNTQRIQITNASGVLTYKNGKILPLTSTIGFMAALNKYNAGNLSTVYITGENNRKAIFYPTVLSGHYAGVAENGSTLAADSQLGNISHVVNNTPISASPSRDLYYDTMLNLHAVVTMKNLQEPGGGGTNYRTSINTGGYLAITYLQEIISFKQSFLSAGDISDISTNRQTYYGII